MLPFEVVTERVSLAFLLSTVLKSLEMREPSPKIELVVFPVLIGGVTGAGAGLAAVPLNCSRLSTMPRSGTALPGVQLMHGLMVESAQADGLKGRPRIRRPAATRECFMCGLQHVQCDNTTSLANSRLQHPNKNANPLGLLLMAGGIVRSNIA